MIRPVELPTESRTTANLAGSVAGLLLKDHARDTATMISTSDACGPSHTVSLPANNRDRAYMTLICF